MPYINKQSRKELDDKIKELAGVVIDTAVDGVDDGVNPGRLNYAITKLILEVSSSVPSYAEYNKIIGVLECLKLEYYRRAVAIHEERKIVENGDVY